MYVRNPSLGYLGRGPFVALLDALVEVFTHVHEIGVADAFGTCRFMEGLSLISGLFVGASQNVDNCGVGIPSIVLLVQE